MSLSNTVGAAEAAGALNARPGNPDNLCPMSRRDASRKVILSAVYNMLAAIPATTQRSIVSVGCCPLS